MRLIITFLCFLFFTEVASAQRSIKMDKKRHDFGTVEGWNHPTVVFELTNNSNVPLLLLPTQTNPNVKVELPKYEIPRRGTGKIKVTCFPSEPGPFTQKLTIYTDVDDDPIKLTITGNIKSFHPSAYSACPGGVVATTSKTTTFGCEIKTVDPRLRAEIRDVNLVIKDGKGVTVRGKTEKNGKAKLQIPSGQYTLEASHPNYYQKKKIIYLSEKDNKIIVEMERRKDKEVVVNDKPKEFGYEIKAVDPRLRSEIRDVNLVIKDSRGVTVTARTEKNGKANVQIPPGKYTLEATHPNYQQKKKVIYLSENDNKVIVKMERKDEEVVMNKPEKEKTKKTGRANYTIGGQPTTRPYVIDKPKSPPKKPEVKTRSSQKPNPKPKTRTTVQSKPKPKPAPKTTVQNKPTPRNNSLPTLSIKVIDSERELYLNDAKVRIVDASGAGKTMLTRGRGTAITELQKGNYDIIIDKDGYQQKVENVNLTSNQEINIPLARRYGQERENDNYNNNYNDSNSSEYSKTTKTTRTVKKRIIKRTTTNANGEVVTNYYEEYVDEDGNPVDTNFPESGRNNGDDNSYSKYTTETRSNGTRADGSTRSKYYDGEVPEKKPTRTPRIEREPIEQESYTRSKYTSGNNTNTQNDGKETTSTPTYKRPKSSTRTESTRERSTRETNEPRTQEKPAPIRDFASDGSLSRDKFRENNVVFLIDVSQSMEAPNKLPLLKQSMKRLTDVLREIDLITVIVYNMQTEVVLPGITSDNKDQIYAALENLEAGGSTRGVQGIETAYQWIDQNYIYKGNNQIILATDGEFKNNGDQIKSLYNLAKKNAQDKDVVLSVIGFGQNRDAEKLMKKLAYWGHGKYINIVEASSANEILVNEIKERSIK